MAETPPRSQFKIQVRNFIEWHQIVHRQRPERRKIVYAPYDLYDTGWLPREIPKK